MKKTIFVITIFASCCISTLAQSLGNFIDLRDGKNYRTIKIGNQVWMAENLSASVFRNGDRISEVQTADNWLSADEQKQPAWCYYNNNPTEEAIYGKLYNWYAISDPRGLAPPGWHIPTNDEWKELANILGGDSIAGLEMKSKEGWSNNGNGTNSSGFNGLASGSRSLMLRDGIGVFWQRGEYAYWWSSNRITNEFTPLAGYSSLGSDNKYLYVNGTSLGHGLYVRCIKD